MTHEEWNDNKFNNMLKTGYQSHKRSDFETAQKASLKILHWYGGGNVSSEIVVSSVNMVWSWTKVGGGHLFCDSLYESPVTATPESVSGVVDHVNTWKFVKGSGSEEGSDYIVGSGHRVVTIDDCKKWYNIIYQLLTAPLGQDAAENDKILNAVCYISYLAMNLCRVITKPVESVAQHIAMMNYSRFSNFWAPIPGLDFTPPPVFTSLNRLSSNIKRGSLLSRSLLFPLVQTFSYHMDTDIQCGVFKSSCMLTFAYTGISIINWMERAKSSLGLTRTLLVKNMSHKQECLPFLRKYVKFYETTVANKGKTWIYCRFFSDGALSEFSVASYPLIAGFLVACVDDNNLEDAEIWRTMHLSRISEATRQEAIMWANSLRSSLQINSTSTGLTEEAKSWEAAVAQSLSALAAKQASTMVDFQEPETYDVNDSGNGMKTYTF